MNRDFKGIWIPKEIWLNKDLTVMEKLFLVEIDSLDNEKGCFASNGHFSEMFQLSKNRCSEIITSLKDKKIIKISFRKEGKQIKSRVIKMVSKIAAPPIRETEYPYSENRDTPTRNSEDPYSENTEGNNTGLSIQKEGETRALEFLKLNNQFSLEQFEMQYKSQIKNWEKFCLDFDDVVDQEQLVYDGKILFPRLRRYARNWIQNQNKFSKPEETSGPSPSSRKIR